MRSVDTVDFLARQKHDSEVCSRALRSTRRRHSPCGRCMLNKTGWRESQRWHRISPLIRSQAAVTMEAAAADIESKRPAAVSHWRLLADQALVTPHVLSSSFRGQGTETEPFIVEWDDHDPRNPQGWANWYKWIITVVVAIASLAVSFCSSAYSGGTSMQI